MSWLWKGLSWWEGIRIGWFFAWRVGVFTAAIYLLMLAAAYPFLRSLYEWEHFSPFPGLVAPLVVWPAVAAQLFRKRFQGFRVELVRMEEEERAEADLGLEEYKGYGRV